MKSKCKRKLTLKDNTTVITLKVCHFLQTFNHDISHNILFGKKKNVIEILFLCFILYLLKILEKAAAEFQKEDYKGHLEYISMLQKIQRKKIIDFFLSVVRCETYSVL